MRLHRIRSPLTPLIKGGIRFFSFVPATIRGATAVLGPPQVEQVAWMRGVSKSVQLHIKLV